MLRAVAVLALVVATTSQPPPASHPPETPPKQQQPTGNRSDTGAPPSGINQLAPEVAGGKKQELDKKGHVKPPPIQPDKASFDWITIFTGFLTLLAALQWWAMRKQARYMRDGLEETKKGTNAATKAANVAEQTLKIAERAYLIASNFVVTGVSTTPELRAIGYSDAIGVRFEIANIGHTHATVTDAIVCITLEELPAIPDYSSENRGGVIVPLTIAPNDKVEVTIHLSENETGRVVRDSALSIFGRISYLDIFGDEPHPLRFARERSGVFVPARGGQNTALPMARLPIPGYEESN